MLTQEDIKELFVYCPNTGALTRRKAYGSINIGDPVGYKNKRGYVVVSIKQKKYYAHRIAWIHVTGSWPTDQIDHINHNRSDNRFVNLREATNLENHKNKTLSKRNTSGILGVYFHKGKWVAAICINTVQTGIGRFASKDEAIQARKDAEFIHGFHENHGSLCG